MKNPGFWTVSCNKSSCIHIDGVNVDSWNSANGDGLDFDGSSCVTISNCKLRCGDDAISIKSYIADPCMNYAITNCVISSRWAAVRFGIDAMSEMGNIVIENCVFDDVADGLKIQSGMGSDMHDFCISNIVMERVHRPIFMTLSRSRLSMQNDSVRPRIGQIRGIVISNVRARMCSEGKALFQNLVAFSGTPERKIKDVFLRDVCIEYEGGGSGDEGLRYDVPEFIDYGEFYAEAIQLKGELPTCGFYLRHIEEMDMQNCRLVVRNADARPAIFAYDVDELVLGNFSVKGETEGLLRAIRCAHVRMWNCRDNSKPEDNPLASDAAALEAMRRFEEMSWACHLGFERMANRTDEAERLDTLEVLSDWARDGAVMTAKATIPASAKYVYLPFFYGDLTFAIDGNIIGQTVIPKVYRTRTMDAYPIPERYRGKQAELQIRWHEPDDIGGFDAKMPFGDDFVPSTVGLFADVEIRG